MLCLGLLEMANSDWSDERLWHFRCFIVLYIFTGTCMSKVAWQVFGYRIYSPFGMFNEKSLSKLPFLSLVFLTYIPEQVKCDACHGMSGSVPTKAVMGRGVCLRAVAVDVR